MTITNSTSNNPFRASVNNLGPSPLAGFDIEVWATDLATGAVLDIGQFQSCTYTVRNATETYLTLGQRIPTYHDGEIQIAWVLERGRLNADNLAIWMGTNDINRDRYLGRGPRFQLTIDFNAPELQGNGISANTYVVQSGPIVVNRDNIFNPAINTGRNFLNSNGTEGDNSLPGANTNGRLHLVRCKVDSMSTGIMPGRRIIADRWEGVAEGIFVDNNNSVAQFKAEARNRATQSRFGGVKSTISDFGANITTSTIG